LLSSSFSAGQMADPRFFSRPKSKYVLRLGQQGILGKSLACREYSRINAVSVTGAVG
jgi:hypothetical protein